MTNRHIRLMLAGVASASLIAGIGEAMAQTRPAAPAAARPAGSAPAAAAPVQLPQGPAIPGICVISLEGTMGTSAVGKFVIQRMQQLQAAAKAEVDGDTTAINTDAKAYEAQKATLTEDARQQRELALNQRVTALQRKSDIRNRELQATLQKAQGRIESEMQPLLQQVYVEHHCSLLLSAQALYGVNPAMDLSPEVVRMLDAKITQFPFDREHMDQPAAAQ
jgi:outer membrane protein